MIEYVYASCRTYPGLVLHSGGTVRGFESVHLPSSLKLVLCGADFAVPGRLAIKIGYAYG